MSEEIELNSQLLFTRLSAINIHITTMFRASSAAVIPPPQYYETIVWSEREDGKRKILEGPLDAGDFKEEAIEFHNSKVLEYYLPDN